MTLMLIVTIVVVAAGIVIFLVTRHPNAASVSLVESEDKFAAWVSKSYNTTVRSILERSDLHPPCSFGEIEARVSHGDQEVLRRIYQREHGRGH